MEKDFISKYKERHGLDDRWETQARRSVSTVEQNKINNTNQYQKKESFHGDCDHVNSLENNTATILYALVMIFAPVFKNWWIIWLIATCIWSNYITRHVK
jgi:hypothetical protein